MLDTSIHGPDMVGAVLRTWWSPCAHTMNRVPLLCCHGEGLLQSPRVLPCSVSHGPERDLDMWIGDSFLYVCSWCGWISLVQCSPPLDGPSFWPTWTIVNVPSVRAIWAGLVKVETNGWCLPVLGSVRMEPPPWCQVWGLSIALRELYSCLLKDGAEGSWPRRITDAVVLFTDAIERTARINSTGK